jgi:hypothetical protein
MTRVVAASAASLGFEDRISATTSSTGRRFGEIAMGAA